MIAVFDTNHGTFKAKLFDTMSPNTVDNFVGLAEGTKEFKNPRTGELEKAPFYNGLTFHRIIPSFMIQGGCPTGDGYGDPGYRFDNENHPELNFDRPGLLAMANSGPNTNGCQFFVTTVPCGHLDDGYTIFGEVIEGMEVVHDIENVPTGMQDRPKQDVVINTVTIER